MAVEHATENQVAGRDRGINGITDQVRQEEWAQSISSYRFYGMQEDREIERLNASQDRLEERIVEIAAGDVGAQIDAAHAWQFAGPLKFAQSAVSIEHGQSQKGDQPSGIGLVCPRRRVIPCFRKFGGKLRIAPI